MVAEGDLDAILAEPRSITGQYLSGAREIHVPERRREPGDNWITVRGAKEHNLTDIDVRIPLGLLRGGHRRERQRQEHARQRHPVPLADAEDLPVAHGAREAQERRRHRLARQGHQHRPVADRPHAALEPGDVHRSVRQGPRALRRHARGEDPRLPAGSLLVQREGRALRGVRGRRHHQDRDALPPGRLRPVRGVQGRALQPRHARHHLQGQEHRRDPRPLVRGGRRVLRQPAGDRPVAADARRRRPRVRAPRPARARRCRAARRSG